MQRIIAHPHALIEATLFRSREFTAAAVALLLFFIGFAVYLLITVLYLQEFWHYSSALRTGLAIAPAPLTAAVFAVNSGRIAARFGRTAPAIAGALCVAASALFWLIQAPSHPEYAGGFLPGLIIGGVGAGLTQAPLFAAASTLPDDRATTASAVLNMARQAGSAIGVAVLVTLLATPHPHSLVLFRRGWILEIGACIGAALATSSWVPFAEPNVASRVRRQEHHDARVVANNAGSQPCPVAQARSPTCRSRRHDAVQ